MDLDALIQTAATNGASDLHLEAGLPAAIRIRGTLRTIGEPLPARALLDTARRLIGEDHWPQFLERRSWDFSRTIQGVRCRLNILQTSRGVGFAIRLLATFQATIERLNLHPDFRKLISAQQRTDPGERPDGFGQILDAGGVNPGDQPHRSEAHRHDREPHRIHFPAAARLPAPARSGAGHAEFRAGAD